MQTRRTSADFASSDWPIDIQVLTLGQILRFDVDTSVTERMRLESLAAMSLTYRFNENADIPPELRYYESKDYKARSLMMDAVD
jgi:predicted aspartyl protease